MHVKNSLKPVPSTALLILSFLSGLLIKLTDDIEDKKLNINGLYAIPCGLAYGLAMGYLMIFYTDASFLFGGIILGCLATGKIDSTGHYFGLSTILGVVFLYGMKLSPLVLLIAGLAALDEIKDFIRVPGYIDFVFKYRLVLKIGILGLVILKIMGPGTFMALIAFDVAYLLTDRVTWRFSHAI